MFDLKQHEIDYLTHIFKEESKVEAVVLFGSRAMGNAKRGSDIDLAIKGKNITFSDIARIKYKLEETIPLPYFFDVADYHSITNADLLEHINQQGKIIYSSKQ